MNSGSSESLRSSRDESCLRVTHNDHDYSSRSKRAYLNNLFSQKFASAIQNSSRHDRMSKIANESRKTVNVMSSSN